VVTRTVTGRGRCGARRVPADGKRRGGGRRAFGGGDGVVCGAARLAASGDDGVHVRGAVHALVRAVFGGRGRGARGGVGRGHKRRVRGYDGAGGAVVGAVVRQDGAQAHAVAGDDRRGCGRWFDGLRDRALAVARAPALAGDAHGHRAGGDLARRGDRAGGEGRVEARGFADRDLRGGWRGAGPWRDQRRLGGPPNLLLRGLGPAGGLRRPCPVRREGEQAGRGRDRGGRKGCRIGAPPVPLPAAPVGAAHPVRGARRDHERRGRVAGVRRHARRGGRQGREPGGLDHRHRSPRRLAGFPARRTPRRPLRRPPRHGRLAGPGRPRRAPASPRRERPPTLGPAPPDEPLHRLRHTRGQPGDKVRRPRRPPGRGLRRRLLGHLRRLRPRTLRRGPARRLFGLLVRLPRPRRPPPGPRRSPRARLRPALRQDHGSMEGNHRQHHEV
ncbi:MAG: Uncharacterized MFS-type transporter, partial [uncultured Rubrobacteraceae bacterium]